MSEFLAKYSTKKVPIIIENNIEPAIIFSTIATQYRLIYITKNLVKL